MRSLIGLSGRTTTVLSRYPASRSTRVASRSWRGSVPRNGVLPRTAPACSTCAPAGVLSRVTSTVSGGGGGDGGGDGDRDGSWAGSGSAAEDAAGGCRGSAGVEGDSTGAAAAVVGD